LLYATLLHLLAGAVSGSVFKVWILLILLAVVFIESAILAHLHGSIAAGWAVANIVGVQVGYLFGIYGRAVLERAGYLQPTVRTRRSP